MAALALIVSVSMSVAVHQATVVSYITDLLAGALRHMSVKRLTYFKVLFTFGIQFVCIDVALMRLHVFETCRSKW
jgi:hypothetical protein